MFGVLISVLGIALYLMLGAGGYKRWTTIAGVYSVCRPQNYEVVCFLDASSKHGGLSCVPLSLAGGACNPPKK
jgi:hypothetical protein